MNNESSKIKSFTGLHVWQYGHELVLSIYQLTKQFPKEEQFGLTNQLRRAAVSVTSNIAEGFGRNSYKEKSQFYYMALGSVHEIQNQLLIAKDLQFIAEGEFITLSDKALIIHKLLNGIIKKSKTMIHNS